MCSQPPLHRYLLSFFLKVKREMEELMDFWAYALWYPFLGDPFFGPIFS